MIWGKVDRFDVPSLICYLPIILSLDVDRSVNNCMPKCIFSKLRKLLKKIGSATAEIRALLKAGFCLERSALNVNQTLNNVQ